MTRSFAYIFSHVFGDNFKNRIYSICNLCKSHNFVTQSAIGFLLLALNVGKVGRLSTSTHISRAEVVVIFSPNFIQFLAIVS